jgi:hypothetical protein
MDARSRADRYLVVQPGPGDQVDLGHSAEASRTAYDEPGSHGGDAGSGLAVEEIARRIKAREGRDSNSERRGWAFVTVYAAILCLAVTGFGLLLVFVRDEDVIANLDVPVARAIQSIHLPVISWS